MAIVKAGMVFQKKPVDPNAPPPVRPRRDPKTVPPHNKRIPQSFTLPFGYKINIRQLTRKAMMEIHKDDVDGIWDSEFKTIDIVAHMPIERKRYILAHELAHALKDWEHWLINEGMAKG